MRVTFDLSHNLVVSDLLNDLFDVSKLVNFRNRPIFRKQGKKLAIS